MPHKINLLSFPNVHLDIYDVVMKYTSSLKPSLFSNADLTDHYIDTIVDSMSVLNVTENYCSVVYFNVLGGAVKELSAHESPFLFNNAK